jgi:putative ABC transport system ATP-binding protein
MIDASASSPTWSSVVQTSLYAHDLQKRCPMGDAEVAALPGVDLEHAPGRFAAVMGPSGSGKPTLLPLLAGLEMPSQGQVMLAGTHLEQLDDDARTVLRRDQVGVVYQFFNLLPTLTAADNVILPLMLAGERRPDYRDRAGGVLERVGFGERADHLPGRLSVGETADRRPTRPVVHSLLALDATPPAPLPILALIAPPPDAQSATIVRA